MSIITVQILRTEEPIIAAIHPPSLASSRTEVFDSPYSHLPPLSAHFFSVFLHHTIHAPFNLAELVESKVWCSWTSQSIATFDATCVTAGPAATTAPSRPRFSTTSIERRIIVNSNHWNKIPKSGSNWLRNTIVDQAEEFCDLTLLGILAEFSHKHYKVVNRYSLLLTELVSVVPFQSSSKHT